MKFRTAILLGVTAFSLSGCSSMSNMWPFGNKNDDTVLPGTRENVLAPSEQPKSKARNATAARTAPTAVQGQAASCEPSDPNYPECLTPDAAPEDIPADTGVDEESLNPQ